MTTTTFASIAAAAVLALSSASSLAQQVGSVRVDFLGPGGHSQNNYGRTSALHAAGRAAMLIQQNMPAGSYVMTNITGGNSVNSIASDGLIELKLIGANSTAIQGLIAIVTSAAEAGAKAENDFRGVQPGDLTGGVPAHIRYAVTDTSAGPRPNPLRALAQAQAVAAARAAGMKAMLGAHDHDDPNHVCDW